MSNETQKRVDESPAVPLAEQIAWVRLEIDEFEFSSPVFVRRDWMTRVQADRVLATMRAALATLERAVWRPVEIAPRDETTALIAQAGQPLVMLARWSDWWDGPAWNNGHYATFTPTHWMHLPEPPDA